MRAYRIAYDGRRYHGFQRQPDVSTVSDAILDALRALDVLDPDEDVPPGYAAAGRTDAGVSALAQTVAFDAPEWLTPQALNAELSGDVRAWAIADASSDFHATHDATAREYEYFLRLGDDGSVPTNVAERTEAATDRLRGRHNFHNLTPDETGTERELSVEISFEGPFVRVRFRSDGFPRQFVRRAVTVVHDVAVAERNLDWIGRVLDDEPLSGPEGIAPAPPYPLVLTDVTYPQLSFDCDPAATEQAIRAFAAHRWEFAARARIAGRIADGIGR